MAEKLITKSFERLLEKGKHRGFITYEELGKSLGKRNLSDQNLAQAFLHILDEKIVLVEKKSDFKVLKNYVFWIPQIFLNISLKHLRDTSNQYFRDVL